MFNSLIVGALILIALTIGLIVCSIIINAIFNGEINLMDLTCKSVVIFCLFAELLLFSIYGENIGSGTFVGTMIINIVICIVELFSIMFDIFSINSEDV